MSAVITRNTNSTVENAQPPTRPDGTFYKYELLTDGYVHRAYADALEDLIEVLYPGYTQQQETAKWQTRLLLAARYQVVAQAYFNANERFSRLTEPQQRILTGPRHEPPVVPTWDCPIPLVLVSTYYEPAGTIPVPYNKDGMGPNLVWIDPSDDLTLLASLDATGVLALHEAEE